MIDPACGSGHFLLGAFARLLDRWHRQAPGLDAQARVQKALDAVHGVDLNPFAIAIARFRLLLAALAGGRSALPGAGSCLHAEPRRRRLPHPRPRHRAYFPAWPTAPRTCPSPTAPKTAPCCCRCSKKAATTSSSATRPTSPLKDKALNQIYRAKYADVCKGTYALTVPVHEADVLPRKARRACGLGRSDHQQLIHETRIRHQAHRGIPRQDRFEAWSPIPRAPTSPATALQPSSLSAATSRPSVTLCMRSSESAASRGNPRTRPKVSSGLRSLNTSMSLAGMTSGLLSQISSGSSLPAHPMGLAGGGAVDLSG